MFNLTNTNASAQDFTFFLAILLIAVISLFLVRRLLKVSFPYFFIGLLGVIAGLILGSQAAKPFSQLPGNYGKWLPIIIDVFVTVGVLDLFLAQTKNANQFIERIFAKYQPDKMIKNSKDIIVDTSILIDGRIFEIIRTGFINGKIIIPQFVLIELQNIADSEDSLRRTKGRRGLDVLDRMQHDQDFNLEIIDELTNSKEPVDQRLIRVAKLRNAKIFTADYNLNKIATIQKIEVLNINELIEAIKPVLNPGDDIVVKVTQEGKEPDQGVGYLSDGTMIVIEGGLKYLNKDIHCQVSRIYQTLAGKMIFAQPKKRTRIR